ncbi:MAG: hypothetical protein WCK07_10650 [Betaproteobacteria bacterium]
MKAVSSIIKFAALMMNPTQITMRLRQIMLLVQGLSQADFRTHIIASNVKRNTGSAGCQSVTSSQCADRGHGIHSLPPKPAFE